MQEDAPEKSPFGSSSQSRRIQGTTDDLQFSLPIDQPSFPVHPMVSFIGHLTFSQEDLSPLLWLMLCPIPHLTQGPWTLWGPACLCPGPAHYLHGGEVPGSVKLELHFNRARAEALVLPANVVIAWPHAVLVALREVVQPQHTVRQLAQTTIQMPSEKKQQLGRTAVRRAQMWKHFNPLVPGKQFIYA